MSASQLRAQAREALTGKWGKGALMFFLYSLIIFALGFLPIIGSIINFILSFPLACGIISAYISLKRGEEIGAGDFLSRSFNTFGKAWGIFGYTLLKLILPIILVIIFTVIYIIGLTSTITSIFSSKLIASTQYEEPLIIASSNPFTNITTNANNETSNITTQNPFNFDNAISNNEHVVTSTKNTSTSTIFIIIGTIGVFVSSIYATVKSYLYLLPYFLLHDNPNMSSKELVNKSEELMNGNRLKYFWLCLTFIGWTILATIPFGIGMFWLMPYMIVASVCFYECLTNISTEPIPEAIEYTQE